jgi:hypothetical protein
LDIAGGVAATVALIYSGRRLRNSSTIPTGGPMAFHSINDPAFWNNCPPEHKHVQDVYREMRKAPSNLTYFIMGKPADNSPTVVCLRLAAGEKLSRHRHDCHRFEIIVQGSLTTDDGRVVGVGNVMTSEPNVAYGPHTAGPEGCTSFEIFSNHEASYQLQLETKDGPVPYDTSSLEGLRAYLQAAAKVNRGEA